MAKQLKHIGVLFTIAAIISLLPKESFAQIKGFKLHRSTIVEKELECVSESLGADGEVTWQDICYSWEAPETKSRDNVVNDALDAFEMKSYNAKSKKTSTPPKKKYYPRKSKKEKKKKDKKTEPSVEDWLKDEYPYFYREYKGKQTETFEESEERHEKESKLYPLIKNVDYGVIFQSDVEPTYYFETVFPIYQSEEKMHTFFSHDRISVNGDTDATYSGGAGYRYYDDLYDYIFGIHGFFDYQKQGSHYRNGFGAEFIGQDVESRLNYYNGLSPRRNVGGGYEQAVDGIDFELGATIPRYPVAKIFGGYQWYNHEHSTDVSGFKSRLEVRPARSLVLNLEVADENSSDWKWRFDGRLDFNFRTFDPKDIMADMKGGVPDPVYIDLTERLLDRVERRFNVRTERWRDKVITVVGTQTFAVSLEIRFPGVVCNGLCLDNNTNGFVDATDGFELDVIVENLTQSTLTGISFANASVSNTIAFFLFNTSSAMSDAGPGATVRTDTGQDMDLEIIPGAAGGASFNVTIDLTVAGQTNPYTFGPFVVGTMSTGQLFTQ